MNFDLILSEQKNTFAKSCVVSLFIHEKLTNMQSKSRLFLPSSEIYKKNYQNNFKKSKEDENIYLFYNSNWGDRVALNYAFTIHIVKNFSELAGLCCTIFIKSFYCRNKEKQHGFSLIHGSIRLWKNLAARVWRENYIIAPVVSGRIVCYIGSKLLLRACFTLF